MSTIEEIEEGTLRLYLLNDDFIKDLHDNISKHVFSNDDPNYNHTRKYLGILLSINGFSYYAPLSSPKKSDYLYMKGHKVIRNSILSIIRMVETDENGKRTLLGTIKLSNMLPVPQDMLVDYDLDNEEDSDYKDLVLKEKRFINRNEELIASYAESLYNEKVKGTSNKGYIINTFDFKKFEEYITKNYLSNPEP